MNKILQQRLVQTSRARTYWLRRGEVESDGVPQRIVMPKARPEQTVMREAVDRPAHCGDQRVLV